MEKKREYLSIHDPKNKIDTQLYATWKKIPIDPQKFYEFMGCPIFHPKTDRQVRYLSPAQIQFWKATLPKPYGYGYRKALCVKSNKIGFTASESLHDFQHAVKLRPGTEILLMAQTQEMANEHLQNLRKLILKSNLANFLIDKKDKTSVLLPEERTKVKRLYIRNALDRFQPSEIIAISPAPSGTVSWTKVSRAHISDITKTNIDYNQSLAGIQSRFANTEGDMSIETVPSYPEGYVYDIWNSRNDEEIRKIWFIAKYTYEEGIKAGLISQKFIDDERVSLGPLFKNYYEGEFGSEGGTVFTQEQLDYSKELGRYLYRPEFLHDYHIPKIMGIDPGFGSSEFAITVVTLIRDPRDQKYKVLTLLSEAYRNADFQKMLQKVMAYMQMYHIKKTYIDSANVAFVRALKLSMGEIGPETEEYQLMTDIQQVMYERIVPILYTHSMKIAMLTWYQMMMSRGMFAISPDHNPELFNEMSLAEEKDYILVKNKFGHTMDLFESAQQTLVHYKPAMV